MSSADSAFFSSSLVSRLGDDNPAVVLAVLELGPKVMTEENLSTEDEMLGSTKCGGSTGTILSISLFRFCLSGYPLPNCSPPSLHCSLRGDSGTQHPAGRTAL